MIGKVLANDMAVPASRRASGKVVCAAGSCSGAADRGSWATGGPDHELSMDNPPAILIVDDELPNRRALGKVLRDGYRILEAASGPEALALLERERVDLVLLDVLMPEMTGYEACKLIKERYRDPFLPVLIVTSLSDQEQRNAGLLAGADDFLKKPVDGRELLLRVRAFLRLRTQDTLIRVQLKKLAELQSVKDEMLAMMVHDLRSPLSGVIAQLQMLIDDLPEGRSRQDARAALRGVDSTFTSLEDTLQIRLLEEGHLPIARSSVDLASLVNEVALTFEPVARRKRVALSTAVEGHGVASLDGKLVRRAIENLLGNAIKYTPAGKDVSLVVRHQPGVVEIEVADRGPGIPEALRGSMFEKFGSVEVKKGGPRKGFGFGLYLVRLVAEGHGGSSLVTDREGGGALFRVRLQTMSIKEGSDPS